MVCVAEGQMKCAEMQHSASITHHNCNKEQELYCDSTDCHVLMEMPQIGLPLSVSVSFQSHVPLIT